MSAQRVGAKWLRRLKRETELDVAFGVCHGGYEINFVTTDHRHYRYYMKDRTWVPVQTYVHYTSCQGVIDGA